MSLETTGFLLVYVAAVTAAWLLTYAAHSTLLIGAVWLLNRTARLARPLRELTWKLALLGGVATATVVLAAGVRPLLGRYETAAVVEARTWAGTPASRALPSSAAPAIEHAARPGLERFAARLPRAVMLLRYAPLAIVLMWLLYAAAVLIRVAYETARARRSLGERREVGDEVRTRFEAVGRSMGLRRALRFTCSERLASPMALGTAEITVPRRMLAELGLEDQRAVVAHEIAHLVRRDPSWLLAAVTTESLFFFQPLNRMARMRWQEQAEYACDELVVRELGSGLSLARALARVAEWLSSDTRRLLAPALAEEPRTLVGRVKALLQGNTPAPPPRWFVRAALLLLPAAVLCGSPAFAPGAVRAWGAPAFHWSDVVPAGQSIEVQGVLGNIRIEPWQRDSVEVSATRHGRSTEPDVHFEVVRHPGGVTICAAYPTEDSVPPNVCTPGATGQYNTRANDVEIEFVVRVPQGVNVVAATATGSISTGLLRGAVRAYSASGDIEIATTEFAAAESQSGDIRVSIGRTTWDGTLQLTTKAGNIALALPPAASVEVSARTQTGTIRSDFEIGQARPSWWSRLKPVGSLGGSAHGVIGEGGRQLELSTVSGDIRLRRH